MVVIGERHAVLGEMISERRQLGGKARPIGLGQYRSARQRHAAPRVHRTGDLGEDHDLAAHRLEQAEMCGQRLDLLGRAPFQQPRAVPARNQLQGEAVQDRRQYGRIARELVAEFDTGVAGFARLGETDLERRL